MSFPVDALDPVPRQAFSVHVSGSTLTICFEGAIAGAHAQQALLAHILNFAAGWKPGVLVLDLERVEAIDAQTAETLVEAWRRQSLRGAGFRVEHPPPCVHVLAETEPVFADLLAASTHTGRRPAVAGLPLSRTA